MSSWWDASGISNLASQALKNAQKKIDKVLDIEEDKQRNKNKSKSSKTSLKSDVDESKTNAAPEGDFWSAWTSPKSLKDNETESQTSAGSSWNLPWGISSTPESDSSKTETEEQSKDIKEKISFDSSNKTSSSQISETSPENKVDYSQPDKDLDSSIVQDDHQEIFSEETDEIDQGEFTPDTSHDLPVEEIISSLKDSSILEKDEGSHLPSKEEINTNEDSQMKSSVGSSYMEISNASGDSGGWEISDSVMKLVEMDEKSKTEVIPSEKNMDEIYSVSRSNSVLCNTAETVATVMEPDDLHESSVNSSAVSGENIDTDFTKEDNMEARPQIISQSEKLLTAVCNVEKTLVDKQSESLDYQLQQIEGEYEVETVSETIKAEDISEFTHSNDTMQEKPSMLEASLHLPSSDTHEEILPPEDDRLQSDSMPFCTDTSDSVMSLSDLSHPVQDENISRSNSDLDTLAGNNSSTGSLETSRLDSSVDTIVDKVCSEAESDEQKDKPYSLFSGGEMMESSQDADLAKSLSPASSFVKCMIEEAMEESGKEDSGSDYHSNGSKSESSKVDSELEKSIYSGHESSDDIETTTSSDIEIISSSLVNSCEKNFKSSYDLPALKINLQPRHSSCDGKGHRRSDSQSSSSTQSKGGDQERLSPDRGDGHGWGDDDLEAVQEEGTNNPYHPERLLKKLAEMAEVLQARENKLVQMSKDNHQLMEDNSILRSQLQQSEDAREAETADVKTLTDEFTVRIGDSERKLQATLRDKESLKTQLSALQIEFEKRSQGTDLEALLEEKTEIVNELMAEGQKLSKQQLQSSNIIKKLRAKEKETDATMTSQKNKIEEHSTELERLKVVLDSKEDMEKKQAEAITQLNAAVQRQDRDHSKALSDLEDAQEKSRGMQTALDNAYKEIAELHRSNASQDSKAHETALSVETSVREELRINMEREQMRFKQEREAFIMQADDLRLYMARLEKDHERREDLLRDEIAHLQGRLQQDEARSQDLSQSITSSTRPLLRQIENLQSTFAAQSRAWEKVEKSLTDRLAEGQTALAFAQEKERTSTENYTEISAKLASIEMTNTRLKQEKATVIAQKEADQSQLEELQEAKTTLVAQFEMTQKIVSQEIAQLKIEKVQLDSQLNLEKNKLESEKKKCAALEEQLSIIAERERPKSRGTPSPSPSMSVSRQESLVGSFYEPNNAFGTKWPHEDGGDSSSGIMAVSKSSVYESLRQSGATIVVENLQSQLKLREGEITQLQNEISQLERTRESMARELVNLTNQNDELQENQIAFQKLQDQFQQLNNRYSAILLMYGEKEEQVQELQLDLQDVKEMYKTQIDALMAK